MFTRALFVLLCLCSSAAAGGRGGHSTTFDPNLFPGATITTINCNGATDSAALASFVSAGVAANPAKQVLRLVGPVCNFESNNGLVWDGNLTHASVQNAVIWAYGTTVNATYFGGTGFFGDELHHALINTVSAGSSTVVVSDGNVGRFSIGDYILVGGLGLQHGGSPPNMQFFEYHVITNINSTTVTLDMPLANSYESTWPIADTLPTYGPAAIYKFSPSWNTHLQVFGLSTSATAPELPAVGRDIAVYDLQLTTNTNFAPSVTANFTVSGGFIDSPEIDKEVALATISQSAADIITIQSPSKLVLNSVNVTKSLNGTADITINGGSYPTIQVGPTGFGHGTSIVANGVKVTNAPQNTSGGFMLSSLTLTTGTFSIAKPNFGFLSWPVPGMKYYYGASDCTNNSIPTTVFTVTDVREDAGHYFADTNISGTPAPTCGGPACSRICPFAAATITQINSPAGSANLTQYAAP